jgi:hypothetical protein
MFLGILVKPVPTGARGASGPWSYIHSPHEPVSILVRGSSQSIREHYDRHSAVGMVRPSFRRGGVSFDVSSSLARRSNDSREID